MRELCDGWVPILLRHDAGIMWWCKHHIGFIKGGSESDFMERHIKKVQQSEEYEQLKSICVSFIWRHDLENIGDGWHCEHGFHISTVTELALDNLHGWHYNHIKDKEEL